MISVLLLSILASLPIVMTLDCKCSVCPAEMCIGDYCYMKRDRPEAEFRTGCLTPREDAWKDSILPLCERNSANATLCLCNNVNECNTVETFASIHANKSYVLPDQKHCIHKMFMPDEKYPSQDFPPFDCQSGFCATVTNRFYNEFRDLTQPPFFETRRQCHIDDAFNAYRAGIEISSPQMNSCLHLRWDQKSSSVICICNTENCNEKVPMYNITKRGKGICYLKSKETETSTCWGQYCFWTSFNRGCLDAVGADSNFKLRLGESALDTDYLVICEGNYCNSDILYPNGTIVGPSAARRFSTNLTIQLSLTSLFILTIVFV